jgi:hypothetical protein
MLRCTAPLMLTLGLSLATTLAPGSEPVGVPQREETPPRIAPDGIPGSLLLTGQATPEEACNQFVEPARFLLALVLVGSLTAVLCPPSVRAQAHWPHWRGPSGEAKLQPGIMHCYDAATGEQLSQVRLDGNISASLISANGPSRC